MANSDTPERLSPDPAPLPRVRAFTETPASAARGRVRLRTLSNLRWMAVGGQSAALFVVYFGFGKYYKSPKH